MWKRHTDYKEKFNELSEHNFNKLISDFSNLEIEDKIELLLYSLDVNGKSSVYNTLKQHGFLNKDIRYHLKVLKNGNEFCMERKNGSLQIISFRKVLEETLSKTLDEKIEICKSYLLYLKIGVKYKYEEIFTDNPEISKIATVITDCVISNNSFDCDEQIRNKIKSIERQERMDKFLNNICSEI